MRVLTHENLQHIFPCEENEECPDEFDVDDIVMAEWVPTGEKFEARIIQIGSKFTLVMLHSDHLRL